MKTKRIVMAALLAALTCVATMIIKIPSPLKGYINLGDCVVLLAGWTLSPLYGAIAAGVGSFLADIFSGYVVYAPATFAIKAVMAFLAGYMCKNKKTLGRKIMAGTVAEIIMILGYFVFEGFLYGFGPSIINIPPNAVQGIAGIVLGIILSNIFDKNGIAK